MTERYTHSLKLLHRAEGLIPVGTQTFSKSRTQFPVGVSPHYIARGRGSEVWDVDGNRYVDFNNALAAVTLGYVDPDVTAAVTAQIEQGFIFTLPQEVEIAVAERLRDIVPCAEMVRFGKNGSDATAGAVRVARAFTGRERVASCGYHGWQDWYIGSTAMHRGVPEAVRKLTSSFTYNDIDSLKRVLDQYPGEFAAVIMEPMNIEFPKDGFLAEVKALAHKHGALLVFDEVVTGFRLSAGGAQELFDVTPDLAAFGKGIANGYPLSALAGRADVMREIERVFFSFTMGSEALSLAAAAASLDKLTQNNVPAALAQRGQSVLDGTNALIRKHGIDGFANIQGHPSWTFLMFKDVGDISAWAIKTLFLQECFARGILTLGSHNMSYAHSEADVATLLKAYDEIFPILRDAVENRAMAQLLKCKVLEPLFRVR